MLVGIFLAYIEVLEGVRIGLVLVSVLVVCVLGIVTSRRLSWLGGWFLILLLLVGAVLVDSPKEVADGRSVIGWAAPIVLASVVLRPWASFLAAGVSGVIITIISMIIGIVPNPFSILMFFSLAFMSWLGTHTLEQALQETRSEANKNQAILEGIADGVLVFDPDWRVTVANPAMLELAGRSADEIVGQDIETLAGSSGADLNGGGWKAVREMLSSGQVGRFEWGGRTLSASLSPVLGSSGGVAGSVAVLRDVTREVEVERARESLFAVAAHELRTPLNAIINFANMMQAGVLPPEQQENTARRIAVNGERLLIIVNNLLERAKMEAGRARLNVRPLVLAELMDKVQGIMGVLAQEKGLELSSDIAESVPATLFGDQERLQQVLINLVGNGIKFTEEGAVRVRVYLPDEEHWALEVADTGSGIPAEARGRIFEPFELAEDPATRKHAGAGLGLSIVKRTVELMGGEVALESEVGQGSTFTVVLPLAPPQEEKP